MMTLEDNDTILIENEAYYKLQYAARLVKMTGTGLTKRLERLGRGVKQLPGSNRVYVKKKDIDFLLGN